MRKFKSAAAVLLGAVVLGGSVSAYAQATRYTVTASNYTTLQPHTVCASGPCQDYAASQSISGWFETAAPLANNLPMGEVSSLVTAFNFSDGINTYSNTDANVRVVSIGAATNASGTFTSTLISLGRWQTGRAPHTATDYASIVHLMSGSGASASHYIQCNPIATSSYSGVADTCYGVATPMPAGASLGSSTGPITLSQSAVAVVPPATPASVPTLSQWGLLITSSVLAMMGALWLRRRDFN